MCWYMTIQRCWLHDAAGVECNRLVRTLSSASSLVFVSSFLVVAPVCFFFFHLCLDFSLSIISGFLSVSFVLLFFLALASARDCSCSNHFGDPCASLSDLMDL